VTEGEDVVGYDVAVSPPRPVGRIEGGAADWWLTVPWVPALREQIAIAAAESARALQDYALVATDTAMAEANLWLQVSSSQNPEWAHELAEQLADAGFEVTVWEPEEGEESYRVMVGPFVTREAAEDAGRRLERPYFVVARESARPPA
jgi:cell division protein FtsN